MRIGLLIYGSLETLSGGYLYDRIMVNTLRALGDEVVVVSLPWRNYFQHCLDNFSGALFRKLKHLDVDLLIQDELVHPSLFLINQHLRGKVPYPMIGLIHLLKFTEPRPNWQNSIYRRVEQQYLASLDGYIFNSRDSQKLVGELVGDAKPGVLATPAGDRLICTLTDGDVLARAHNPGPLRLLFLGNVIERKGLEVLLHALEMLPHDGWHLDIVGRTDMEPGYYRKVAGLAAQWINKRQVAFHGAVHGEELRPYLQNCQVLVLPSFYEGFGIVYLEGMGFGLPAIGTSAGAAGEIIQDGVSGYLIEPGNANQLANRLEGLVNDRALLAELSLNARRRFAAFPGWEASMGKIYQFIHQFSRPDDTVQ